MFYSVRQTRRCVDLHRYAVNRLLKNDVSITEYKYKGGGGVVSNDINYLKHYYFIIIYLNYSLDIIL